MSNEVRATDNTAKFTLNDAQRRAVEHPDGPVLVVAGAGTGKTSVIAGRIQYLIDSGVEARSILALTFTEKAAGEMLDRVGSGSTTAGLDATIATFNGFGNDLLQAYGVELGLGRLRLLGETGQLVFLREHLDELGLDYFAPVSKPDGQLDTLTDYVSLLKQQLVQPDDYKTFAGKLPESDEAEKLDKRKHQELAHFFDVYLRLCLTNQAIDYDDQIYLTLRLLRERPNILKQLQERYLYILVDEFQDTNPMQSALVDLLVGKSGNGGNIMVVGDDDQSIYGWRGATLANILDFKERYTSADEVTLIENYRSSQPILDSAYRLIQHNNPARLEIMNKLDKRLRAQGSGGEPPTVRHFSTLDAELNRIAEDIAKRLVDGQDPSSIAVLARRNHGVQKMHEVLELHDVPHAVAGLSNDVYEQATVRQLIEAVKAVADPLDDVALFHMLGGPLFSIEPKLLARLSSQARREHQPLAEALADTEDQDIQAARAAIDAWRAQSADKSVGDLAYQLMTESGWKQRLYTMAEHDIQVFVQVQALSKFFTTLKEFERVASVASAEAYVVNLPTLQAAGSGFEDASLEISSTLINVLSVHRAKGLEWDTVYIIDCSEGSFPMRNFGGGLELPEALKAGRSQADDHMAEERRLMYVAATRARRELLFSYADTHSSSGSIRKPSRFLAEMFDDAAMHVAGDSQTSLELFAPKAAPAAAAAPLPDSMLADYKLRLNVSQIECYLRCPEDFYYKYILAMPEPAAPQLAYGTAIHSVIEQLHRGRQNDNVPQYEAVLAEALAALPKTGYISVGSRERARAQAEQTVRRVYDRFTHDPLPLETEKPFAIELPDAPLIITGRIDAVYALGDTVEVRDFKTGTTVTSPEQAKRRATGSNQLALYALAWKLMHDEMPALLSLDFVETGQIGSVRKQEKSLITLTGKLVDMDSSLRAGSFPPGNDHSYCSHPL